jgi:DNA anti-recombination protein RmuC
MGDKGISAQEWAMYQGVKDNMARQGQQREHDAEVNRLVAEINDLRSENKKLKIKLESTEDKLTEVMEDRKEIREDFESMLYDMRDRDNPLSGIFEVARQHAVAAQVIVLGNSRSDYKFKRGASKAPQIQPDSPYKEHPELTFELETRREANLRAIAYIEFWTHYVSDLDRGVRSLKEAPAGDVANKAEELANQIDLASNHEQEWVNQRLRTLRENVRYAKDHSYDGKEATVPIPESIPDFLDSKSEHSRVFDTNKAGINDLMMG